MERGGPVKKKQEKNAYPYGLKEKALPLLRKKQLLTKMNILELSEQEIQRRNSLEELRKRDSEQNRAAAYPENA